MSKVRLAPPRRTLAAVFREGWHARGDLGWALDVLRYGICGECSLGTHGWRDELLGGVRLCPARMDNLRRWTAGPLAPSSLRDAEALADLSSAELRSLGRLSEPCLWRCEQRGFQPVTWDDALKLVASRIQESPRRWKAGFNPSELSNEAMFCLSELVSSGEAAALCSPLSPSQQEASRLLEELVGSDSASCRLEDLAAAEVVLLAGCDLSGEPLLMEHLAAVEKRGGAVHRLPCELPLLPPEGRGVVLLVGPQIGDREDLSSASLLGQLREQLAALPASGFIPVGWPPGYRGASDLGLTGPPESEPSEDSCSLYLQLGSSLQETERQAALRVHQVYDLDPSVLDPAEEAVLLIPMQSRFEMEGGGTYTSLVGHVRFSPEIRGHQIGSSRPDWWALSQLLSRIEGSACPLEDGDAVRRSLAQLRPIYSQVSELFAPGEGFEARFPSSLASVPLSADEA